MIASRRVVSVELQMDLTKYFSNIVQDEQQIWRLQNQIEEISYPSHGNKQCAQIEEASFWFAHRTRVISTILRRFPPNGPLFDIGGGNGIVSLGQEKSGFRSIVVEPGADGVMCAKSRGLESVVQARFQDLKIVPGTISAIGLFDVYEHIPPQEEFLREINHALAEKGKVYITVPAFQSLWSYEDVYAEHVRRYTTATLSTHLTSAGFVVLYSSYLFSYLLPPLFLFRTIPSLLSFRKEFSFEKAKREHTPGSSLTRRILDILADAESSLISNEWSIPFGTSLIMVAQKA
jgi:SAM-dependent methyltransferase